MIGLVLPTLSLGEGRGGAGYAKADTQQASPNPTFPKGKEQYSQID